MDIIGTSGNDTLRGTTSDDRILPNSNTSLDYIVGSTGNDTIDFAGANDDSYYWLDYEDISGPVEISADNESNSGSIVGPGFVDTLLNPTLAFQGDGLGFEGTVYNDVFNINSGSPNLSSGWFNIRGSQGDDTFNLTMDGRGRIQFRRGADGEAAPEGLVLDLSTGIVSNDGFGDTDQINILGGSERLEIQGTYNDDLITGSSYAYEGYILEAGNDTVNGNGGYDVVRFDRSNASSLLLNLATESANVWWDGVQYNQTLIDIDAVWGTTSDDTMQGG